MLQDGDLVVDGDDMQAMRHGAHAGTRHAHAPFLIRTQGKGGGLPHIPVLDYFILKPRLHNSDVRLIESSLS